MASSLFSLLGADGHVLALVTDYTHIWLLGFPCMGLAMVSNGLIRSFGNVTYPGYIMTVGPAIQVLLGPFLIFGLMGMPKLGLNGAAWTVRFRRSQSMHGRCLLVPDQGKATSTDTEQNCPVLSIDSARRHTGRAPPTSFSRSPHRWSPGCWQVLASRWWQDSG